MKMKSWLAGSVFLLVMVVIVLGIWLQRDRGAAADLSAAAPLAERPALNRNEARLLSDEAITIERPFTDSPLAEPSLLTYDATQSMSLAREHGDARQPTLQRDTPREMPTAQELADPDAYQQYEARQNQRLRRAYVSAADAEIPRLQSDIERARHAGLSPEQIAEGEEKLRRIQAMRDQLQTTEGTGH